MKFIEIKIFQPTSFEDFRGELFTLFKDGDYDNLHWKNKHQENL